MHIQELKHTAGHCVHRSWARTLTHMHNNHLMAQNRRVLSRLTFLTSSSSSVQLNIPFQHGWQDAGSDISLRAMFIGVTVYDCTAVCFAVHSVCLIFRFSLSKGRDLVSECFMHRVSRVGVCHF